MTATRQLAREIEKRINYFIDGEKRAECYHVTAKVDNNGVSVYPKADTFYCTEELVKIADYNNKSMYITVDGEGKLYAHIY